MLFWIYFYFSNICYCRIPTFFAYVNNMQTSNSWLDFSFFLYFSFSFLQLFIPLLSILIFLFFLLSLYTFTLIFFQLNCSFSFQSSFSKLFFLLFVISKVGICLPFSFFSLFLSNFGVSKSEEKTMRKKERKKVGLSTK